MVVAVAFGLLNPTILEGVSARDSASRRPAGALTQEAARPAAPRAWSEGEGEGAEGEAE